MARFLIGTVPVIGHVNPGIPIAHQLIQKGHEVWWYTGQAFQSKIEAIGATFVPMVKALDYSNPAAIPQALIDQRNRLSGLAQLKSDLKTFFVDSIPGQVQDYLDVIPVIKPDLLIADSLFLGPAWVHELQGIPWAQFGSSVLTIPSGDTAPFGLGLAPQNTYWGKLRNRSLYWLLKKVIFRDVLDHVNQVRATFKLPLTDCGIFDVLSPFLYLAGTVPEFEYPRQDCPPQVHFVGPLLPEPPADFTPPDWWSDLQQDCPVIHVTQGTVTTTADQLILPTLQGLAEENVLVVATTGGQPIDSISPELVPKNARIATFLPHHYLLPHVDVMVTNGGYNGVQIALSHGVPLVAAGKTEDKIEVCARIAWAGVGINLKTQYPTATQIRSAVQTLLSDPSYRSRAQALQQEMKNYNAARRSVELLEKLVETQRPVLNATPRH